MERRSDKIRIERDRPKKKSGGTSGVVSPNGAAPHRPVVRIVAGQVPRMADEAEQALIDAGAAIYSRSGVLVRPITDIVPAADKRATQTAKLKALTRENMAEALSLAAEFQRFNIRKDDWTTIDPPTPVVALLLAREGQWRLRASPASSPRRRCAPTAACSRSPATTRQHASISPRTRSFHAEIPERPSRAEAERALQLLSDLLTGFPFVEPIDKAVALSCLMTPALRGALPTAPLQAINAPTPGTGKSFLIDLAATISTGRLCPVIAAGKTEEETEKRLASLLIAGVPIVSIDNVSEPIGGDFLCQFTERPLVHCRILGRSEAPEFENRSTIFVNGNNLRLLGDMSRRGVLCRLDAERERPETRRFSFNPIHRVLADRGTYVAAILTIARAYKAAGSPEVCADRQLRAMVRARAGAALWLGEPDTIASIETIRAEDPERANRIEVIAHWREHLGLHEAHTAHKVITKACEKRETYSGAGRFHQAGVSRRPAARGRSGRCRVEQKPRALAEQREGQACRRLQIPGEERPKHGNSYSLVPVSVGLAPDVTDDRGTAVLTRKGRS